MSASIEKLLSQLDSRPLDVDSQLSRRERYRAREKAKSKRNAKKNSEAMWMCDLDWEEEDLLMTPRDKNHKNKKPGKKDKAELPSSENVPPETSADEDTEPQIVFQASREEKMQAMKERLTKKSQVYYLDNITAGYLPGRVPFDYYKKKNQEEEEIKILRLKKALRVEKEKAANKEKAKKEAAEDWKIAKAMRLKDGSKKAKKASKKAQKMPELTDPALAPSAISLFAVEKIPSAPVHPPAPKNLLPIAMEETNPDEIVADDVAEDSLYLQFDDLFDPSFGVNVDEIVHFEQAMEHEILADFQIFPSTSSNKNNFQPMLLDEVEGCLYHLDDADEPINDTYGIDDQFLEMMNDDQMEGDPVQAYKERFPEEEEPVIMDLDNYL